MRLALAIGFLVAVGVTALVLSPGSARTGVGEGYGVLVASAACAALVNRLHAPARAARGRPQPPRPRRRARPGQLDDTELLVRATLRHAGPVERRLRPLVVESVAERLRHRGLRDPAAAGRVVGPLTWDLVRPDRPAVADRMAPGLSTAELAALIEELERL